MNVFKILYTNIVLAILAYYIFLPCAIFSQAHVSFCYSFFSLGYGMTELTVSHANTPQHNKPGSCGKILPEMEYKVFYFKNTFCLPIVAQDNKIRARDYIFFFMLNCLFVCFRCFTSHVNSYGHCGMVSSLNHTFSWAGLSKRLTSNLCTYFRL